MFWKGYKYQKYFWKRKSICIWGKFFDRKFCRISVVNTEKGNIVIDDAVGGVEAITSAGDIDVDLSYDSQIKDYSIYMETHMGNIKTSVPKNLPASMENIVYQTTSMQSIDSEIILKLEVEHEKVIGKRTIAEAQCHLA